MEHWEGILFDRRVPTDVIFQNPHDKNDDSMNNAHASTQHVDLQAAAKQAMLERGFEPEFPEKVADQLAELKAHPPQVAPDANIRDLRNLLWSSIDNDTSRDLDQIEVAEKLPDGSTRVLVGVADVDAYAPKGTPIDLHAGMETTTVYTGVRIFPMLPEELSTAATSLLEGQDRLCIVTEYVVDITGNVTSSDIYRAVVRNKAQLAYPSVGAWLEGKAEAPPKVAASAELQAQLKLQDAVAQALKQERHRKGALDLDTIEVRPVMEGDRIVDVAKQEKNRATELIEDFMIAANEVVARTLEARKVSSIRRIVKTPERWERIVELASRSNDQLPAEPDSKALNQFLMKRRSADPDHFADLSLSVIKLLGPGEYVLERPGQEGDGHFGLAVQDYTHSTAPNRRYADMVTQRLVKAILANGGAHSNSAPPNMPYTDAELESVATNCTQKGDAARKVEREMSKRISAVAMCHRIGEVFDGIITGVTTHGTFVRVLKPHVEGLIVEGEKGVDVGDRVRVRLVRTNVERGYIDFARA